MSLNRNNKIFEVNIIGQNIFCLLELPLIKIFDEFLMLQTFSNISFPKNDNVIELSIFYDVDENKHINALNLEFRSKSFVFNKCMTLRKQINFLKLTFTCFLLIIYSLISS